MRQITAEDVLLMDSSVAVKWFRNERNYDLARQLRNGYAAGKWEICIADLTLYEIGNALINSRDFTIEEVGEFILGILELEIAVFLFDSDTLISAIEICVERNLAIYDAYLVALAQQENLLFVTSDERLYRKLAGIDNVIALADVQLANEV